MKNKLTSVRTYHCHRCGKTKEMNPKKWGKSNLESWCYCNPLTPMLMSPTSEKELDKKYGSVFKNPHAQALGSLGGKKNTDAQKKARAENGRKGGRPRLCIKCRGKVARVKNPNSLLCTNCLTR